MLPGYDAWKTHNPDDDRCEFCGVHLERITKLEQQMIELQRGIDQLQQAMLGLVIFLSKVEAAEGNENGL